MICSDVPSELSTITPNVPFTGFDVDSFIFRVILFPGSSVLEYGKPRNMLAFMIPELDNNGLTFSPFSGAGPLLYKMVAL